MFSSNKPFHSFDRPQKPFSFVGVNRVLKVLLMGNNFQVAQSIIGSIKVFVVNFQTAFNATIECFPHHAMHTSSNVFGIFAKTCDKIVFQQLWFDNSVRSVTGPSLTQLDRISRGYAGAQKLSNLFKGGTVLKHLLGFGDFGGVNRLASSNTTHVSKITHLVQIFKIQNWFPRFHSLTPFNMNGSIA